jgi:hypothetical protein
MSPITAMIIGTCFGVASFYTGSNTLLVALAIYVGAYTDWE